jgi:hypothetical protein
LEFAGVFNGTLTDSWVHVQTRFTAPIQHSLLLGHNLYTVTLTSYVPPGPPAVGSEGKIGAFVDVHPVNNPEPSSLVLAGLGLAGVLGPWLRRRGASGLGLRHIASA